MATTTPKTDTVPDAPAPLPKKRSLLVNILLGIVALLAVLAVVIATRPSDFSVTRSATFAVPPATVFAQVNDFHAWDAWSPWSKLDPNAKNTFEGPPAGEGAKFSWDGDANVGAGSMTILESKPDERIRIQLDFVRPFAGTSDVLFTFKPAGDQTNVTWTMSGKNNFIAKAIGLIIDCDKMIGGNFEQGLASMKTIVESPSKQ